MVTKRRIARGTLKQISRDEEPARWAAEQLKLGAALRAQARQESSVQRVRTLRQAIRAFEEALCYYCKLLSPSDQTLRPHDAQVADPPERDFNADGIDLVLNAIRQPYLGDCNDLEEALALFSANCSDQTRASTFSKWFASRLNRVCALTLLGKIKGAQGDGKWLERAVETCHELLTEPVLRDLPIECALVYINLAETLSSLADITTVDESVRYLESATDSLAMALRQVVPESYTSLVQPKPISFN